MNFDFKCVSSFMLSLVPKTLLFIVLGQAAIMTAAYANSYQEVHDVVFTQAEILASDDSKVKAEKSLYLAGELPAYTVTYRQFKQQRTQRLASRSKQTLMDEVDYYDRLEKLVHSNGICMAGSWYITQSPTNAQEQTYTGMFAKGAVSPFIGRLSVALSETKQGEPQGFGMAGKLFGIADVNHSVITENFFVADVLTGTYRDSVFDAPMTNKPKIGFRFSIIGLGLKIAPLFGQADEHPTMRPVSGIAKMGLAEGQTAVSPEFMMLLPMTPKDSDKTHPATDGIDFRDEFAISSSLDSSHDSHASHATNTTEARYFAIYVSDIASNPEDKGWQHIGFIKADETIVSYGCDRQLHFNHPKSDTNG